MKSLGKGATAVALLGVVAIAAFSPRIAIADDEVLAALIGKWVLAEDETGDLSISEITVEKTGSGLIIASGGSSTEYEPADDGDFLRAEGSGANPLTGKAAQWVRIDGDGIHVHRMESTSTGGIDIVSEEIFLSAGEEGVMRYRRLAFTDGISTGISSGTFGKEE